MARGGGGDMNANTLIAEAVAVLRSGGLVAFPTETVYGLGADAANADAVRRIFAAKGRPVDHPLIVHLARFDQVAVWARTIPPSAVMLAQRFWPGPMTLILPRAAGVLDEVTGGRIPWGCAFLPIPWRRRCCKPSAAALQGLRPIASGASARPRRRTCAKRWAIGSMSSSTAAL